MKRSARLAMELANPKRMLAPLQALDLPRNLVRQGLEKVWDLGLKISRQAVLMPIQAIKAAIRGIGKPDETLEKTLDPKKWFRLGR